MNKSTTRRKLASSRSPVDVNAVGSTEYTPSSFKLILLQLPD